MSLQDSLKNLLNPKPNPVVEAKILILGRMSMEQLVEIYKKYIMKPASIAESNLDSSLLGSVSQISALPDRQKLVMAIAGGLPLDNIIRLAKQMEIPLDGIVKV